MTNIVALRDALRVLEIDPRGYDLWLELDAAKTGSEVQEALEKFDNAQGG